MADKTKFRTHEEYIGSFPREVQQVLQHIRQTILKAAPEAEETISYNMPTFRLNGQVLIYYAAWKEHYSIYPTTTAMERELKEIAQYTTSGKGTIQFPADKPVPFSLITKIVQFRIKENKGKK